MSMNVSPKFYATEFTEGASAVFPLLRFEIGIRAAEVTARSRINQIPLRGILVDLD
jgi:hypothetical protein